MASKKYYERLLMVVGTFLIFFVITMISLPLIILACHIDNTTRDGMLVLSVYQAVVMFIAPSIISARIVSRRPVVFLQLNRAPSWLGVVGVVFAYLISLPALNQIIYWNSNISFPESVSYLEAIFREMEDKAAASSSLMLEVNSWGGMIVNLLVIGLLTALGEELFFRGTLQHTAGSSGAHYTAIWVVALIFSTMHFQAFGFVPRLLLGAWFGYLLYWTRSIYIPILAHFINNGVVVVCTWISFRGSHFDFDRFGVTEYGFPMPAFISAVAFVVFVFYFRNFFFRSGEVSAVNSHA